MKKKLLLVLLLGLSTLLFADTIWVVEPRWHNSCEITYTDMTYVGTGLYAKPNTYTINSDSGILFVWDNDGIKYIYHSDWEIECK